MFVFVLVAFVVSTLIVLKLLSGLLRWRFMVMLSQCQLQRVIPANPEFKIHVVFLALPNHSSEPELWTLRHLRGS